MRISDKKVGVANGGAYNGKYVTSLTFPQLSSKSAEVETFKEFPTSLMSMVKTADDGNVSIFTKDGVTVYKEENVLITCLKNTIIIGERDERDRYQILLTKNHRQWQPRSPTKEARKKIQKSHSVYYLPSKEDAVKWIHTVCGYPVKSTWIKSIKLGNYVGWPKLNKLNVARYYPKTNDTPKVHLNQSRKNGRSTKPKRTPL